MLVLTFLKKNLNNLFKSQFAENPSSFWEERERSKRDSINKEQNKERDLLEANKKINSDRLNLIRKLSRESSDKKDPEARKAIWEQEKILRRSWFWYLLRELMLSTEEFRKVLEMSSTEFLWLSKEDRLKFITKEAIDFNSVSRWEIEKMTFNFPNDNLQKYITAWQVLPIEVGEVESDWLIYSRKNITWEFFTEDNKRLIILNDTELEVTNLRTKKELEELEEELDKKTIQYLANNKDANKTLIKGAVDRWLDPEFIDKLFWPIIKNLKGEEEKIKIEELLTDFDRKRWYLGVSSELKDWKYDEKLVMILFLRYSNNWKKQAADYWINEEKIKWFEWEWEQYMNADSKDIINADSLENWDWLRGKALFENPAFKKRLEEVSTKIWAKPEDLKKIMMAESYWDPRITNGIWATWLIQFTPATAKDLGTTVWQIRKMTWVEQLDLVEKYFERNSRWRNLSDITKLYQAIFYPNSLTRWKNFVFGMERWYWWARLVANQNPWIRRFSNHPEKLIDYSAFSRYVKNRVETINV